MRLIINVLFYLVFMIISIPLYLIAFIIRLINEKTASRLAQYLVVGFFKIFLWFSGAHYTVIGREQVPTDTAVLYAANHRSFFDIILAYSVSPTLTAFVSKKSIKKMPCVAQWMYFLNCLFLDRDDIKQGLKTILRASELAKNGYSIYIAPEGTRNTSEELLPFKNGSFKIAQKAKCPIIPVALIGTEEILENHLPWIRKGNIAIVYGEPIYLEDLSKEDRKQIGDYVREKVKDLYEKNLSIIK